MIDRPAFSGHLQLQSHGPRRSGDHSGDKIVFRYVVSATPPPDPPVTIDSFTRDDSTIELGESTTLRWTTSNADSVTTGWGSL